MTVTARDKECKNCGDAENAPFCSIYTKELRDFVKEGDKRVNLSDEGRIIWSRSFEEILRSPPLTRWNVNLTDVLCTDKCQDGTGAVLCQQQNGEIKPCLVASKGLNKSQRHVII